MKVLRRGMLCRPNRRALLARMVHIASLTTSLQHRALAGDFAAGEDARPDYVRDLENSFGEPNQDGFGSTVLYASSTGDEDLDMLARAAYRYFLGGLWETRGESTWMAQWRMVHERSARGDIVGELHDLAAGPVPGVRHGHLHGHAAVTHTSAALILHIHGGDGKRCRRGH